LPDGIRTHWKAPPFHGAHPLKSLNDHVAPTRSLLATLTTLSSTTLPWEKMESLERSVADASEQNSVPTVATIASVVVWMNVHVVLRLFAMRPPI
jgi:hypothetical protein